MPRNWPILVLKTLSPSVPDSSSQKCLQLSQARRTLTTAAASSPSQLEGMSRYHQSPAIGWGAGGSEAEEERTWLYSWRNFWDSCVTQLRNQTPTTGHFPAGPEAQGSEGGRSTSQVPVPWFLEATCSGTADRGGAPGFCAHSPQRFPPGK